MNVSSYRDLKVWQASMDLVESVYCVTRRFPTSERYGLTSQLQRSVISIPSNLAEGHARSITRDYLRFVGMARGSLAELQTQLIIAARLGDLGHDAMNRLISRSDIIGKMLRGLQIGLERAARRCAPSILDPRSSTRISNAEA